MDFEELCACSDFGGPALVRTLGGRLTAFCKGGGSGAAIAESKKGRLQGAAQFSASMAAQQKAAANSAAQFKAGLEASKQPVQSAAPTTTTADTVDASTQARREAAKRQGLKQSLLGGESAQKYAPGVQPKGRLNLLA